MAAALPLPRLVRQKIDSAADALLQGDGAPAIDFSAPKGEPALVAPDSVSWRIFKNPVSLFVGGVAAVILELAEPGVRTGVWEHSSFRKAPVPRLKRTGMAAMITVYGPRSQAEAMIGRVVRMHDKVAGQTPAGAAYRANDVDLLDWVQATALYGFGEAYHRYVADLGPGGLDRLYAEGAPAARLYGAVGAPASEPELAALFDAMRPRLEPHPIVFEFLDIMRSAPALPGALRLSQGLFIRAAVDMTPPWVRARLGLQGLGLRPWERPLVKHAGALADRLMLPSSAAVQSCLRLGLPGDYLYR